MAAKKDDRLAWGITLLTFGCLFLLRQFHLFTPHVSEIIFEVKNYPLIMGVIFLLFHSNKTIGLVLIVVGLLFRLSDIIKITQHISDFIWPILLILGGILLVFGFKKGK
jgi:mannose/fructose/N-acetylgalactosamine-specific phosphotransferase system component IIC